MQDNLKKATNMAFWLWTEKGRSKSVAAIIACNKFKLNKFSKKAEIMKLMTKLKKCGSLEPMGLFNARVD